MAVYSVCGVADDIIVLLSWICSISWLLILGCLDALHFCSLHWTVSVVKDN